MPKVLVVYYSRSGNTKTMAELISQAVKEEGLEVETKEVEDTAPDDLLKADGIIIGSPTYYGTMAAEVKKFLDDSVSHHSKLDGKVGAAFASAAVSGHETTVMSILEALMIHGMIIQGDPKGGHYGAVSLGAPGDEEAEDCKRFGKRVAKLVKRVSA
jgi:NAD(P)H dehydrogenase (quinone)